jgi:hypothetical protein
MNISDEAVEAAALAAYGFPFDQELREATRARLRIALTAAAPHLMAEAWDEGKNVRRDYRGEILEANPYRTAGAGE